MWQELYVEVRIDSQKRKPEMVYSGPISKLQNIEILKPNNYTFAGGLTELVRAEMWLESSTSNKLGEQNVSYEFVINPN